MAIRLRGNSSIRRHLSR